MDMHCWILHRSFMLYPGSSSDVRKKHLISLVFFVLTCLRLNHWTLEGKSEKILMSECGSVPILSDYLWRCWEKCNRIRGTGLGGLREGEHWYRQEQPATEVQISIDWYKLVQPGVYCCCFFFGGGGGEYRPFSLFKLRLGALIPRSFGLSVCLSVCLSTPKITKLYKTLQHLSIHD